MDSLELKNLVRTYLAPDEEMYWCDRPVKKVAFSAGGLFWLLFGIVWIGFAVFWTAMSASFGAPLFFSAFGGIFILIGVCVFFAVPLIMQFRRSQSVYAVTDRRILQVYVGSSKRIVEYKYSDIDSIYVKSSKDGTGSVYFSLMSRRYHRYGSAYATSYSCGIIGINDPENVYRIISEHMTPNRRDAL